MFFGFCIAHYCPRIKAPMLCGYAETYGFADSIMKSFPQAAMQAFLPYLRLKFFTGSVVLVFTVTALVAQSPAPTPSVSLPGSQSPFTGSEPEGQATSQVLQIGFEDAIDRGLRNNLGLILAADQTIQTKGERWKELSNLLPNFGARLQEDAQTLSLTALGFKSTLFPTPLPRILGPFNYFDARLSLTQSLFSFHDIEQERAAEERLKSANYSLKDARELVVLAVGNEYLLAIASAARIETAVAQVENAQALYNKAVDQLKAGLTPSIDALRAQVELQTREQQLIAARNDYAKQKLSLARIIGLPTGQEFVLTEKAPYEALTPQPVEVYLQQAYSSRADYRAAQAQVRAAEFVRHGATAGHYPTFDLSANFGDIGATPGQSNGTWQVNGGVNIPIFAGGKTHSDVLEAEEQLKQARSQLNDLRGRIDYEVRASLLDLNSAAQQVEVARSSVDLAEQALAQSRDRFTAGVTDNLEVVQAQEAAASAHESYIESLYAHNLAKVELARAIGDAEQGVERYLKGRH
jgi:outer membrane protein TolC